MQFLAFTILSFFFSRPPNDLSNLFSYSLWIITLRSRFCMFFWLFVSVSLSPSPSLSLLGVALNFVWKLEGFSVDQVSTATADSDKEVYINFILTCLAISELLWWNWHRNFFCLLFFVVTQFLVFLIIVDIVSETWSEEWSMIGFGPYFSTNLFWITLIFLLSYCL